MIAARLSDAAIATIAASFRGATREVGGLLALNAEGTLDVTRMSGDGRVASVTVPVGPVMFHTHPGTCVNYCRRVVGPNGRPRRRCVRTRVACAFGTPSSRDVEGFFLLATRGRCHTHLVASRQGSAYVMYARPGFVEAVARTPFRRLGGVDRAMALRSGYDASLPGHAPRNVDAVTVTCARRLRLLARRLEDDFSRNFHRTDHATFARRWVQAVNAFSFAGMHPLLVRRFRNLRAAEVLVDPAWTAAAAGGGGGPTAAAARRRAFFPATANSTRRPPWTHPSTRRPAAPHPRGCPLRRGRGTPSPRRR